MKRIKMKLVSIRLYPDDIKIAKRKARQEARSFSGVIRELIRSITF